MQQKLVWPTPTKIVCYAHNRPRPHFFPIGFGFPIRAIATEFGFPTTRAATKILSLRESSPGSFLTRDWSWTSPESFFLRDTTPSAHKHQKVTLHVLSMVNMISNGQSDNKWSLNWAQLNQERTVNTAQSVLSWAYGFLIWVESMSLGKKDSLNIKIIVLFFILNLHCSLRKFFLFPFLFFFKYSPPHLSNMCPPDRYPSRVGLFLWETTTSLARNLRTFHVGHTGYR